MVSTQFFKNPGSRHYDTVRSACGLASDSGFCYKSTNIRNVLG
jgi:hypothetical protein